MTTRQPYSAVQLQRMELQLMALRYAYYIERDPLITDRTYDLLEKEARRWLPPESPIQRPGSNLASSYSAAARALAAALRQGDAPVWKWVDSDQ